MVLVLDTILLFALLPWIWRAVFFVRLLVAAITDRPVVTRARQAEPCRFVIIVPAHNEEAGLAKTLASIKDLNYPAAYWSCLVVADNCDDQTAEIAQKADVWVTRRQDDNKRGKGYALEFAIDELIHREVEPDAIVIVDADTVIHPDLLLEFAEKLEQGASWIQAYYTVANPDEAWRSQLLSYALSLFNGVWLIGQERLGLGAALRGNGMCFRWQALNRCPLRAYGLAEDLEYSWRLRLAGEHVDFAPAARVYGEMPTRGSAAVSQRQRWESGRKSLQKDFLKPILGKKELGKIRRFDLLSDLYMWPFSRFLALTLFSGLLITGRSYYLQTSAVTGFFWAIWLICVLAILTYSVSPFRLLGLPLKRAKALFYLPAFVLWKLWLLAKPAPKAWQRTPRQGEKSRNGK